MADAARRPTGAPAHAPASPLQHFFGGWLGGSIACVLLSPLEVIKTRLQSSVTAGGSAGSGGGIASSTTTAAASRMRADRLAAHIVRTEGIVGFYRGLVPHLLGVGPSRAFYFGTYNFAKRELGSTFGLPQGPSLHLTAAALASVVSATIMSPVWVVKTRLQLQSAPTRSAASGLFGLLRGGGGGGGGGNAGARGGGGGAAMPAFATASSAPAQAAAAAASAGPIAYSGMAEAFTRIYKEEGARAFYRGLTASYLGVIETALQFSIYGTLKERVTEKRLARIRERHEAAVARARGAGAGGSSSAFAAIPAPLPTDRRELQRLAYDDWAAFFTSAAAKLIAALATYPHEVLRTRMREQVKAGERPRYTGVFQAARLIAKEEGPKALYGGLGVHMVRTVPNAAILLMVVERVVGGDV
jgi:solute carrier family 25 protein 33/36